MAIEYNGFPGSDLEFGGYVAGVDVGGTKTNILNSDDPNGAHRYETVLHPDVPSLLDQHFQNSGSLPRVMFIGMAGPKDDHTGSIALTNAEGPPIHPSDLTERYPGMEVFLENDMFITAAGMLAVESTEEETKALRQGEAAEDGNSVAVTISTGIGAAGMALDRTTRKRIPVTSQGGHIEIFPGDELEAEYLRSLSAKGIPVTAESAIAGGGGIDRLIDFYFDQIGPDVATDLRGAIQQDRIDKYPTARALLKFAESESSNDDESDIVTARAILDLMGGLTGSALRNLAVAYKSSGGVYLTGSVSHGLGPYLAEHTTMNDRFASDPNNQWLKAVPIELWLNENVAVEGALDMAKKMDQARTE